MRLSSAIAAIIFMIGCGGTVDPSDGDDGPMYPASDEATAPGVEAVLSLGANTTGLECSAGGVYWFDGTSRRVVRFENGNTSAALHVEGSDPVSIRGSGDHLVVGSTGDHGRVWIVTHGEEPREVHAGKVDAVAAFGGVAWWHDGSEIRGSEDARAFPADGLVDLAANSNGPAWFDEYGTLRLVRNGGIVEAFVDFVGFRTGTLRGVSDVVAWGSTSGVKVLPEDTGVIVSRERMVDNLGSGDGTITFCQHVFGTVVNVFAMQPRKEAVSVADHETCVETVRCGAHVYWTTESGSLLRAKLAASAD